MKYEGLACLVGVTVPRSELIPRYAIPGRDGKAARDVLTQLSGVGQHPLIVAPIFIDIPFEVATDLANGRVAETICGMRMALAVDALGLPAVALPVGTGGGLPQSVQIIGPRYREDLCLDAAAALEDRVGIITPIDPR